MKMPNPMIIYEAENGRTHIEVQLDKDTLWLNLCNYSVDAVCVIE